MAGATWGGFMSFQTALAHILRWEGGYSEHPADPGGATNYGITQATYDAWRRSRGLPTRSVREIAREEVEAIYLERYWTPSGALEWDQRGHPGIALYVFDSAVQHGVRRAKDLVKAVGEGVLDNYPIQGLGFLHRERVEFYLRLETFPTFGRGWMRRVADILAQALLAEIANGQLGGKRLDLNGQNYEVEIARMVGDKLFVRTNGEK